MWLEDGKCLGCWREEKNRDHVVVLNLDVYEAERDWKDLVNEAMKRSDTRRVVHEPCTSAEREGDLACEYFYNAYGFRLVL